MGIHPLHGNGVFLQNRPPNVCAQPWLQYEWQTPDRVSREEVARAIAEAESNIEEELGYRLLPSWEEDEWQLTARTPTPELIRMVSIDVKAKAQVVQADWGYLVSGGVRASELVDAAATIIWSDEDGDGYDETGTITVAIVAGTPLQELHVYYPGQGGTEEWEIKPLLTWTNPTAIQATLTFRREQCVLPNLFELIAVPADDSHIRGVDGDLDANFLTTVDVYRVYNDPQTQVTFLWEPFGTGACSSCNGSGCNVCAYSAQMGCLMLRSQPRQSIVSFRPANWDADVLDFVDAGFTVERQPDIARLYYYAGWRDKSRPYPSIQMDSAWERCVAYYAAAMLDRPVCECNNVHAWVERWRRDVARPGEEGLRATEAQLNNPFGTRMGALYAWNRVKGKPIGKAVMA